MAESTAVKEGGRRPLARRVLLSFAVVVLAFAATVVVGLTALRQAARDVNALSLGYLPLETAVKSAFATQGNVAAQLDRLLDNPRTAGTTRGWLETLVRGRPAALAEARAAALGTLGESPHAETRDFGREIAREIDEIDRGLADSAKAFPDLFGAIEGGDKARAEAQLRAVAATERAMAERLHQLAIRISARRLKVVENSDERNKRTLKICIGLMLASVVVALVLTRELSRRMTPLGRLTARAKAIAAGDRSPLEVDQLGSKSTSDEISELAVAFAAMVDGVATRDADLLRLRRRQEDIVNHLRAAVIAVRTDGVVEAANPPARMLFDVRVGDSLASDSPMLWEIVKGDVAHAIGKGVEPESRVGVKFARDTELVIDLRVVPMRAEGEERLALIVADDVSEAAIARSRALQAERLAAIGKMAAHITHEIRNPLSSIGLNVELLEETLAKASNLAEARKLLAAIAREVGRLSDVSEDYLRVARLPSPRPAPIDLAGLVRDVVAFARPELERARVSVELAVPNDEIVVAVDEAQVRQALLNLVRNAREAMEDGGRLRISLRADETTVTLEVEDEGPGIDEELRARIFDPFFTTKSTGTGLGLPLTRQIVEAHGGGIACTPVSPHGTRFSLRFPRARAVVAAPSLPNESRDAVH